MSAKKKPLPPRDAAIWASFTAHSREQFMGEMSVLIDAPASRKLIEEQDPVLLRALYAKAGFSPEFGKEVMEAMQRDDSDFLKRIPQAMAIYKSHRMKQMLRGNEFMSRAERKTSLALHAFWVTRCYHHLVATSQPEPTKAELQKLAISEIERGGSYSYEDASDWRKVWRLVERRCGIFLDQLHVGRSQTTSGVRKPRRK